MYRMYRLTKNPEHQRMAQLFDKSSFLQPLVQNRDNLAGLHANTHLAQVGAGGLDDYGGVCACECR